MTFEIPGELRGRVRAVSIVLLGVCKEPILDEECIAIGHLKLNPLGENEHWLLLIHFDGDTDERDFQ